MTPPTASSALPRAIISGSALAAAAAAAVQTGDTADLRADAWGHGGFTVASVLMAAGVGKVLVDCPEMCQLLRDEGIRATVDGEADIDSRVLYGLPDSDGEFLTMPVLSLQGRVLSTKPLRAGEAVSYGYTHRAERDTRLALVTGGYAQGIPRALGNAAAVEIRGMMHPIVGRVAMDVCVVDIGTVGVQLGDAVTYFGGAGPAAAGLARWANVTGLDVGELVAVAAQKAAREGSA